MRLFINFLFPGVYKKPKYIYSSLNFDQLPAAARQFLIELELAPPSYGSCDAQKQKDLRHAHIEKLWHTLDEVHAKIVTSRQVVAGMSEEALDQVASILDNLKDVLVPEWHAHLDRFFVEFDALVWVAEQEVTADGFGKEDGARDSDVDDVMDLIIKRLDHYYEVFMEAQMEREAAKVIRLAESARKEEESLAAAKYCTWPRERVRTWNEI